MDYPITDIALSALIIRHVSLIYPRERESLNNHPSLFELLFASYSRNEFPAQLELFSRDCRNANTCRANCRARVIPMKLEIIGRSERVVSASKQSWMSVDRRGNAKKRTAFREGRGGAEMCEGKSPIITIDGTRRVSVLRNARP